MPLLLSLALMGTPALAHAQDFPIVAATSDPSRAEVTADVERARRHIERFFGKPFREPVTVTLASSRAAFSEALGAEMEPALKQCWAVGVGIATRLAILSPSVWNSEACDHDGSNAQQVQDIVTHELTHAFHGQYNPTGDFTGMDDEGWFVEGLAVLVAGQLDHGRLASAADAIASGAAPTRLAQAWSGKYRYGVCGSMVAFIDARWGRATLVKLLEATDQSALLAPLGLDEAQFLARWRAWVVVGGRKAG